MVPGAPLVALGARDPSARSLNDVFTPSLDRRTEIDRTADKVRDESNETAASALEVTQYAAPSTTPDWWTDADEAGAVAKYFETESDARDTLDLETIDPERRDEVDTFIMATDFDRMGLLYLTSVGPSRAYDTIDVTDVDGSEAKPIATARVVDAEKGKGGRTRAGAALTFPSALVRLPLESERVDDAVVRIVDGWGDEHEVRVAETPC